ncbi:uncharacterized protein HMPREF1541_04769 [Cyphellophora europaea CBS 101466]|uniref:Major facilitator superfamily (MFS) profile domain-containing protein n=1 Tax=Cyphellophora europaea (strain CBS 101466) TaxID=1220924 RepID=W2RVM7_CYPE1|nr:uncharacterized protein HMPREF1541_04769 [Cyphellophora europaea CBS 101466]ETN40492.1 hypothetical protein HMPREF1541_04769 [Cyphellophora europaea CBS 101466]
MSLPQHSPQDALTEKSHAQIVADDMFLVAFEATSDSSNPKDWPLLRKWAVTSVLSVTGFNRIMVSTIMAPALPYMSRELQMDSVESLMALSVYLLATAVGPLLIGPASELYGRAPILHSTNVWFFIWNLVCGFAHNKATLIASRLLAGLGASAIYSLGNGVLGDVWPPHQRGRSMGIYQLIPLLGAAVGPILGGFIVAHTTWRWIFWSTSALQAVAIAFSFLVFRETYAPTILEAKASQLRKSTGDDRYHTQTSWATAGVPFSSVVLDSLSRPLRLLLFHPVIQIQTLLSGWNYGLLYLVLATYSSLWTGHYHQSVSSSGLHYLAMCLGEIFGAQIGGFLMDRLYRYLASKHAPAEPKAEFHIPLMTPAYIMAASGLLIYGWTAHYLRPWPVVDIGAFLLTFGMTVSGQVINSYVIDSYPDHVASASAAAQLVRSLTAFGFPLFGPAMFGGLGYGWSNTLLASISLVLGLPSTMLLWRCGSKLRERILGSSG